MGKGRSLGKYTDEQILAGIRDADHDVFTDLYSRHFQGLSLVALKYVKDIGIAEEIVQDVFLRVWENPVHILGAVSLKAYLYRAVVNHAINYVNRQKNIAQHHQRIADEEGQVYIETLIEDNALKEMLYHEIEKLPEQCRKVFKMSRFEDMKYREIASRLGIAEKTVENHIVNALKTLRATLLTSKGKFKDDSSGLKTLLVIWGVL